MLGGLAADQRAAGHDAGLGDAADDGRDPLGDDGPAGDVVGHEQRLGAGHHDVVDDHPDQVEADGVVDVEPLGDLHLGAHAVRAGGQQRPLVGLQRADVEQPGEAADAADHLGPAGLGDPRLHQLDGTVAGLDVDAGTGVGDRLPRSSRRRHGRDSASGAPPDRPVGTPSASRGSGGVHLEAGQRLEHVLAELVGVRQLDRVLAGEAGPAEPVLRLVGRRDHAVLADVAEAVGADAGAHLLDPEAGGDQLGPAGEVDAVEARPGHRRRRDPHVHLGGAGLAQHPDLGALGVAAHDRVVDDDQPLAPDHVGQRVELEPDAELADGLAGLDERAARRRSSSRSPGRTGCRWPRRSRSRRGCRTPAPR